MGNMDSLAQLPEKVVFAVQWTLIIFFIGAPTLGWMFAKSLKETANVVLAWSVALIMLTGGNFGLNLLLRDLIAPDFLGDEWVAILSAALIIPTTLLLTRFLLWMLAEPEQPAWMANYDTMDESKLLPFERRRRETIERRNRARRR